MAGRARRGRPGRRHAPVRRADQLPRGAGRRERPGAPAGAAAAGLGARRGRPLARGRLLDRAAELLPALGRRVFLTTGRTGLAAFAGRRDAWFLVRSVEPPDPPHPPHLEVLLDRGPFTLDGERALLRRHRIDVLVTKDSGGAATAPKLTAAREAGLPVIVVRRPPVPDGVPTVPDPAAAVRWVREVSR
ncbi:hypothetical protein SFUMM280S_06132 [Streptomyces fumanus]